MERAAGLFKPGISSISNEGEGKAHEYSNSTTVMAERTTSSGKMQRVGHRGSFLIYPPGSWLFFLLLPSFFSVDGAVRELWTVDCGLWTTKLDSRDRGWVMDDA